MIPLKYNPDKKILKKYYSLIKQNKNELFLNDIDSKCIHYLNLTFEDVVTCSPKVINGICKDLEKDQEKRKIIADDFNNINIQSGKKQNNYIISTLYKTMSQDAKRLIYQSVGTKVCPYCNRNYIEVFKEKKTNNGNKNFTGTFQLDHFYPKDKFPMFAVSFYNLIPVCGICNSIKGDLDFKNNPYLEESTENIIFSYNILGVDYLKNEVEIEVTIDGKKKGIDDARRLHLTELYNGHKDIVQEIMKKVKYYNPSYISSVLDLGGKLFSDREELYRILYGGYANPEDFGKRPLSKFIRDIYLETVESTGGYDILQNP